MSGAVTVDLRLASLRPDVARLPLRLGELRLPTVAALWPQFTERARRRIQRHLEAFVSNDIRNPAAGDTENPATPVTLMPRPAPGRCWT